MFNLEVLEVIGKNTVVHASILGVDHTAAETEHFLCRTMLPSYALN